MRTARPARWRATAMGATVVLALVASACGSDDPSETADAPTAPAVSTADTTPTTQTTPVSDAQSTSPAPTSQGASTTLAPTDIDRPDTLTIAVAAGNQGLFGAFFAAQAGSLARLADQLDMKIETFTTGSGADAMAALTGGSAQMCLCGVQRVIAAVSAGEDITSIFNPYGGFGVVALARSELESTAGTDIANFGDKTWAYNAPGGASEAVGKLLAENAGLNFDDINTFLYGDSAAAVPTLQSGQADLVLADPAAAAAAISLGVGYIVANFNDPVVYLDLIGDVIGTPINARTDFVDKYPDFTQAVVSAFVESLNSIRDASADDALAAMTDDFRASRDDPSIWEAEWPIVQPALQGDGSFSDQQIADTFALAVSNETITAPSPELEAIFDNRFVDQAYESLGLTRPAG